MKATSRTRAYVSLSLFLFIVMARRRSPAHRPRMPACPRSPSAGPFLSAMRGASRSRSMQARNRSRRRRRGSDQRTCRPPTTCPRRPRAPDRRSRSSTRTTTRTPRPTSPSTARSTACRPARRPTAASRRSTSTAAPPYPPPTPAGPQEISLDLDMVSRRLPELPHPARRGRPATSSPTSAPPSTRPSRLGANVRSPTATAAASRAPRPADDVALQPPGIAITVELRRQRLRRGVPGRVAVRHRRRRHLADAGRGARGWTRDRLERRRQRLLGVRGQAGLAEGHRLPTAYGRRRLRGRRPDTGVAVYTRRPGLVHGLGGTSASSPIIAGVYALAGNAASVEASARTRTRTRAR